MELMYSIVVPVYNRPDETDELLESLTAQTFEHPFEVVIVEDGSTETSEKICEKYREQLDISYYFKENSGPGDSRNYGMRKAKGNYFIILDSDCILPPEYLTAADESLRENYVDCFGGPDASHSSFTTIQKAISYAMTSFLTTGGIRGHKNAVDKFQPRSFNMGISKAAFEKTQGFGKIHPGEDPDLTIRIWKAGFETKFIEKAFVYHKRRISWKKFYKQVYKFGLARPILNKWHPHTKKITYWFPAMFVLALAAAILIFFSLSAIPLLLFAIYFTVLFLDSLVKNKSIVIAFLSLYAVLIQFLGYGYGFLRSSFLLKLNKEEPEKVIPELFFD
ncbi:glycosyltransferase [Leptobacterium flavescens]|uniref:Glycosyltransferase n=1 Tax=Leptobacterium flavescens TaxID=472055 RepID=A0A6P0ULB5_9FLAO|nr:glycosyltransferase [Leptobacterium flavescens]NER13312.1 glycosyltransferase [Leptobacterium flavescens]